MLFFNAQYRGSSVLDTLVSDEDHHDIMDSDHGSQFTHWKYTVLHRGMHDDRAGLKVERKCKSVQNQPEKVVWHQRTDSEGSDFDIGSDLEDFATDIGKAD